MLINMCWIGCGMNKDEKMPKEFVRKFLKARGWKFLHSLWCDCQSLDEMYIDDEPHPIKWLYNHIKQGHKPSFDCCHGWDRQVGRDGYEFEEWYKWWTFTWNEKMNNWEMTDCFMGDGYSEEQSGLEMLSWNKR